MASYVFNIAKGRVVEYYNRVEGNDPSTAVFTLVPLSAAGTKAQGEDFDTLALLLADSNFTEQTGGSWVRKVLTDSELATFPSPDDVNNRYDILIPDVTWTAPITGNDTVGLLICYDAIAGSGTDANIIPVSFHDFINTADGQDIILPSGIFFRAS